ncbi:hypothetical protein SA496_11495 [Pseudomonas sp. JS3066]|jgi:hypothetical protein|uniref:hypothetical protein n=1 Tax=unclassified Pseudomonas TaxID=196821 RepID=UPI0013C40D88|nr:MULTISPECIES: hypothetical protein [unclassified Pseudomonas]WVK95756.1 hypothetical protein SA496_11495 [Pseudomonas sp. JS3066]
MAISNKSASAPDDKPNEIKRSSTGRWFKALAERLNLLFFQLIRTPDTSGSAALETQSGRKATKKRRSI